MTCLKYPSFALLLPMNFHLERSGHRRNWTKAESYDDRRIDLVKDNGFTCGASVDLHEDQS